MKDDSNHTTIGAEHDKIKIENCRKKIQELNNEIELYKEEILRLEGKTYVCLHCDGEGRHAIGHSFTYGTIYSKCIVCKGTGKVTKERLEEYKKDGAKFIWRES